MSLLTRRAIILAKIELVYGTDPTPTGAADAILVRNLNPTPLDAQFVDRALVRPYLGSSTRLPTAKSIALEFEVEVAGSGAAGTPPKYGPLLRACGFAETISAGVSVAYAPVSSAFESVTIYFNQDGVLHKATGCRGNVSVELNALQIPVYKFRFVGIFATPTDTALPTPDFTGFQVPLPVNKVNTPTFTMHGFAGVLAQLQLDMANQIVFRSLVGFEGVLLTDRQPAGRVSMEATTVAAKDWWTSIANATTGALSLIHGVTPGNKVTIAAPNLQITDPTYADSDGIVMLNGNIAAIPGTSGNDEVSITCT